MLERFFEKDDGSPAANGDPVAVLAGGDDDPRFAMKSRILADLNAHPFSPAWWMPAAHGQTAWSVFYRQMPEVAFRSERWETPDDDFLCLHITEGAPEKPTVLLLHGLEGSVQSNYMMGMLAAFSRIGWRAIALEHRTCGEAGMNRAKRTYHSGETSDLDFVVRRLSESEPGLRLYIVGVSLGGNITAKWLGDGLNDIPECVRGASAICPPFDLTISAPALDDVMWGAYNRRFFRTLIPKALEKAKQYPGILNVEKIEASSGWWDFDTYATAALHDFDDAEHYWQSVSCGQFLGEIDRPTLLIAAEDDPFNPPETLPREIADASPYLYPQFTRKGGHVGFIHGTPRESRHWAEEQTLRFFEALEREA